MAAVRVACGDRPPSNHMMRHRGVQSSSSMSSDIRWNPKWPQSRTQCDESARSVGRFEFAALRIPPEALQVVEATGFVGEGVDDAVEAVNEDPLGVLISFDVRRP